MGHMYPENISKRLIKKLHEKQSSLKQLVEDALKSRVSVSCAEGKYKNEEMLYMAFEECLHFHLDEGNIKPILKSKERQVWKLWVSGDIFDEDDTEELYDILDNISLTLTKKGKGKIAHLEAITH